MVASFRLGATERKYDRDERVWIDGPTNWFTVSAYRQLASHASCSIKKGQPVIVVGRLRIRQWEKDGKQFTSTEIDAEALGHDLMWGSANFVRDIAKGGEGSGRNSPAPRKEPAPGAEEGSVPVQAQEPAAPLGEEQAPDPQPVF